MLAIAVIVFLQILQTLVVEAVNVPVIVEEGPLGQSFDIPKKDLLSKTLAADGVQIATSFNADCFVDTPLEVSEHFYKFYSSTKQVYGELQRETDIEPSLKSTSYTMKTSLDAVTHGLSANNENVVGFVLKIFGQSLKRSISQECLNDITFTSAFDSDFKNLPKIITNPKYRDSWAPYKRFLDRYGTHMVRAVTYGSSIYAYSFSEASTNYEADDFMVKACVGLRKGVTSVPNLKVNPCEKFTQAQREKSSSYEMNERVVIRGGTTDTRAKLLHNIDEELIAKFMDEGHESPSPVMYRFIAIWQLLKKVYSYNSPHFARAKNLEEYFKGYLSYGCELKKLNGHEVQRFDLSPWALPIWPWYQCMVRQPGCLSNNDCNYRIVPALCSCNGPSCVENRNVESADGTTKREAYAYNGGNRGTGHGCRYQYIPTECHCDYPPGFLPVWQLGPL